MKYIIFILVLFLTFNVKASQTALSLQEDGGGDYTTIEDFLTDNSIDITTNDTIVLTISESWAAEDAMSAHFDVDQWLLDGTETGWNVIIQTVGASRHDGTWTDGAYVLRVPSNSFIDIEIHPMIWDGIQFIGDATNESMAISFTNANLTLDANPTVIFRKCISKNERKHYETFNNTTENITVVIENSLFIDTIAAGAGGALNSSANTSSTAWEVLNSTFVDCEFTTDNMANARYSLFRNVIVSGGSHTNSWGSRDGDLDSVFASAVDTADGWTGEDSANVYDATLSFIGGDDYHIQSGSDAVGIGTDLSSYRFPYDDDVDDDSRTSWDAGFDEFVAAVGGEPSKRRRKEIKRLLGGLYEEIIYNTVSVVPCDHR